MSRQHIILTCGLITVICSSHMYAGHLLIFCEMPLLDLFSICSHYFYFVFYFLSYRYTLYVLVAIFKLQILFSQCLVCLFSFFSCIFMDKCLNLNIVNVSYVTGMFCVIFSTSLKFLNSYI